MTSEAFTPPTDYHVHATSGPGEATIRAGALDLAVDTAWARPAGGAPGPADLLASAFAACLLKNLERTASLIGFDYEQADVDVTVRRQEVPPRFVEVAYEVRVRTDEPDRRLELAHTNLAKFGTVYNTLAAVCDVHGRLVREAG